MGRERGVVETQGDDPHGSALRRVFGRIVGRGGISGYRMSGWSAGVEGG